MSFIPLCIVILIIISTEIKVNKYLSYRIYDHRCREHSFSLLWVVVYTYFSFVISKIKMRQEYNDNNTIFFSF